MIGWVVINAIFLWACFTALRRPWIGITCLFSFALLQPEWNWQWSISRDSNYQKYLFACTFLGWMLQGFKIPVFSTTGRLATWGLACYLALAFLAGTQSIAPVLSDFYLNNLWRIVAAVFLAIFLLDSEYKLKAFLWSSTLSQSYNAFRISQDYFEKGWCQWVEYPWGWASSNQVSNVAGCCAMISFCLYLYAKDRRERTVSLLAFSLQVHQVMLLESRGVMLGTLAGMSSCCLLAIGNRSNARKLWIPTIVIFALAGPSVQKEFSSIFKPEGERDSSAESRWDLWEAGIEITKDYPWLGVGPYAAQAISASYLIESEFRADKTLHNLFLEISAGCGIPALLCYVLYLIGPMWAGFRRSSSKSVHNRIHLSANTLISGGGIGFIVLSMFSAGGLMQGIYVIAIAGIAGGNLQSRKQVSHYTETETVNNSNENGRRLPIQLSQ